MPLGYVPVKFRASCSLKLICCEMCHIQPWSLQIGSSSQTAQAANVSSSATVGQPRSSQLNNTSPMGSSTQLNSANPAVVNSRPKPQRTKLPPPSKVRLLSNHTLEALKCESKKSDKLSKKLQPKFIRCPFTCRFRHRLWRCRAILDHSN